MPYYSEGGPMAHHCARCKKISKRSSAMGYCDKHMVVCSLWTGADAKFHRPWYHYTNQKCDECPRAVDKKAQEEAREAEAKEEQEAKDAAEARKGKKGKKGGK